MDKKALVVFYSKTGTTEKVGRDIAAKLGADVEKLTDKTNRKGIMGFFYGGRDASRKFATELAPLEKDPANYDIIIIGTPCWAATITPAVRTYIQMNKAKMKNAAFFTTSGFSSHDKMAADMAELSGVKSVLSLGLFIKEIKNPARYAEKLDAFVASIRAL